MEKTLHEKMDAYGAMIAKASADPAFKAKLMADPQAVFKEAGLALRPGVTLKVVENTDKDFYVVLPTNTSGKMTEEMLEKVAGGDYKAFLGGLSAALPFAAMFL